MSQNDFRPLMSTASSINKCPVSEPIGRIVDMAKNKEGKPLYLSLDQDMLDGLNDPRMSPINANCDYVWMTSSSAIISIQSELKNIISKHIVKLKLLGVLGKNYNFSKEDKDKVKNIQFGIFNIIKVDRIEQ